MADSSKRQSTMSKSAPSKAASGLSESSLDALSKAIGGRIQINSVVPGLTWEGTIFTVCPFTGAVAINCTPESAADPFNVPGDFVLVPIVNIQSFKILSLPPPPTGAEDESAFSIMKLDMAALKARADAEVQRLKDREEAKRKGVTKEGQEIFDHFNRMYDTRWHGLSIIVDNAVRIDPPYKTENLKAPKEKQAAVTQMKKVLEGYYQKKKSAVPAPTGRENRPQPVTPMPRKGG